MLSFVLTYHVVSGKMDSKAIVKTIKDGKGKATLTTVQGGKLIAVMNDDKVILEDESGTKAVVTIADVNNLMV
jgi:uncharacterized surface protein with fasciclin (FAS1) repeats